MKSMVLVSLFMLFQAFEIGASLSQAATSPISVEISSPPYVTVSKAPYVTVSKAHAEQEDKRLKISGTVTRSGKVNLPGHVDLLLLAADGTVLEKRRISVPGLHSNRKGRMDIRFVTTVDITPPAGSRAVLRYHAPGAPQRDC